MLFLLLLLAPSTTLAQATARHLEVVAEDGTVVPIGEVSGAIEVEPGVGGASRFGAVRVRAGLVLEARATERSEIPVWLRGTVGPIEAHGRVARIDALERNAEGRVFARVVLGDVTVSDVPIRRAHWEVAGPPPVPASVAWRDARQAIPAGTTTIFDAPVGTSMRITCAVPLPVRVIERRGLWRRVRAVSPRVTIEGWMRDPALVPSEPIMPWIAGEMGAISGACASEGDETVVAAGTPVHLSVDGPVWAHTPDEPTPMWVRDGGRPWVEIHFADGMQRAWPDTTCSLGWIRREALAPSD